MQTQQEILIHFLHKQRKAGYGGINHFADLIRKVPKHQMEAWYKEARDLWKLELTYEDFRWLMERETTSLYFKYYSYCARRKRRAPLNENDRGPREKPGYGPKKVLSEEEKRKREWKKRFIKDKKKRNRANQTCRAKKFFLKYSSKMHRQWEKQMINHGKYDEMCDNDYKLFVDPWLWD